MRAPASGDSESSNEPRNEPSNRRRRAALATLVVAVIAIIIVALALQREAPPGVERVSAPMPPGEVAAPFPLPSRPDLASPTDSPLGVDPVSPPRTIDGLVLHAITREPIAGARVEFFEDSRVGAANGRRAMASLVTGSDGRFDLLFGSARIRLLLEIRVSADGFIPSVVQCIFSNVQEELRHPIELLPGLLLTGEVLTGDDRPVASGAVVAHTHLYIASSGFYRSAADRTSIPVPIDGFGRFSIVVSGGLVAVEASVPGYAPSYSQPIEVTAGASNHVRIRMAPGEKLPGRVIDRRGEPIAGATIEVHHTPGDRAPEAHFGKCFFQAATQSRADGTFLVDGVTDRIDALIVSHPSYGAFAETWTYSTSPRLLPRDIVLDGLRWLEGRAVDANESPLPGGTAVLCVSDRWDIVRAVVGADGALRLGGFSPHSSSARLLVEGVEDYYLAWARDENEANDPGTVAIQVGTLRFRPGMDLPIAVFDAERKPLPGAIITVEAKPCTVFRSDKDGRALLRGLSPRIHQLVVTVPGFANATADVDLAQGTSPAELELILTKEPLLLLQVVDDAGSPCADALAIVDWEDRWKRRESRPGIDHPAPASPDGRMAIAGVPLDIPTVLTVWRAASSPWVLPLSPFVAGEVRDLGAIATGSGITIEGRVTDESMRPIAGAFVRCVLEHLGGAQLSDAPAAITDPTGRFAFGGVPDGEHRLECEADGFIPVEDIVIKVVGGQAPVALDVVLIAGTPYEGVVVHADGSPAEGYKLQLSGSTNRLPHVAGSGRDGSFRFDVTPQGHLTLTILDARKRWSRIMMFGGASVDELPARIVLPGFGSAELKFQVTGPRTLPGLAEVKFVAEFDDGTREQEKARVAIVDGVGKLEDLAAGAYELSLEVEGFPPVPAQKFRVNRLQCVTVTIALDGAARPIVVEVAGADGEPLGGAHIYVDGERAGMTDQSGRYETHALSTDGLHSAYVWATGFVSQEIDDARSRVTDGVLRVTLQPEAALRVEVRDHEGNAVEDAEVCVHPVISGGVAAGVDPCDPGEDDWHRTHDTGGGGSVRVGSLGPGAYVVGCWRSNIKLTETTISLAPREERSIELKLPEGIKIHGIVRVRGMPVREGWVQFETAQGIAGSADVDDEGRYELTLGAPCECLVKYGTANVDFHAQNRRFEKDTLLDLEFSAARLTGRVLLPDGTPSKRQVCYLNGASQVSIECDLEGRFVVDPIALGHYEWEVPPPAGTFAPATSIELRGDRDVVFALQAIEELEVAFDGERVPELVWVTPVWPDGSSGVRPEIAEHPDDSRTIRVGWPVGARGGRLSGIWSQDRRLYGSFALGENQGSVRVEMVPGSSVVVRARGRDASVQRGCRVEVEVGAAPGGGAVAERTHGVIDWSGKTHFFLPAGTHRLTTRLESGERASATITLGEYEKREVELRAGEDHTDK